MLHFGSLEGLERLDTLAQRYGGRPSDWLIGDGSGDIHLTQYMRFCIDEAAAVAGTAATTRELNEKNQNQEQDQTIDDVIRAEIDRKNVTASRQTPVLTGQSERIFGSQRSDQTPNEKGKGALLEESSGGPILRGTIPFIGRQ